MGYKVSRRKHGRKVWASPGRGYVLPLSHMSKETNQIIWIHKTVDNVIGTSKFPHSNFQNGISFYTLITLKREWIHSQVLLSMMK